MLALYRRGGQAEVLEAIAKREAALDELGLEPSERLRRLERSILSQDPVLAAPEQLRRGAAERDPDVPVYGCRRVDAAAQAAARRLRRGA